MAEAYRHCTDIKFKRFSTAQRVGFVPNKRILVLSQQSPLGYIHTRKAVNAAPFIICLTAQSKSQGSEGFLSLQQNSALPFTWHAVEY